MSINGLLLSNFKNFFFAVKHVFSSKITILHIFDCLEDNKTKKEKKKFVTRVIINFSPISYEKIDNSKFVNFFQTKNFVTWHFFCILHRCGAKWNYSFLITFFTIKAKTTCSIKKWTEVNLYIFLIWTILSQHVFFIPQSFV